MSPVTYQTIKLGKGKHSSPDDGACVMELASMLAGESFTDHPSSVCPVIGSFLRAYNDSIDDERRQDLYTYASKVVGSRTSADIQRARAEHLSGLGQAVQALLVDALAAFPSACARWPSIATPRWSRWARTRSIRSPGTATTRMRPR